jgi:hexosaminidase
MPCDQPQGDNLALGATLCYWPDNNVGEEINVYRHSPVVPAMLAGAERYWRGGAKVDWKHISMFPLPTDPFYPTYKEFESRLLAHRDIVGKEWDFPYVSATDMPWKLLGPIDNGGAPNTVFPPETELKDSYDLGGKTFTWVNAHGGTIHINHFFDYPGWLPKSRTGTAYATTNIWSPRKQTVGFWIGFNSYSMSGHRGGPNPNLGQWSNTGSKIWVNDTPIDPPTWKLPGLGAGSDETPFVDEDYFYRPPTQVALKKGWNRVFVKVPRNGPAWKWQLTCVPVSIVNGVPHEVEGLKFSAEPMGE